MDVRSSVWAVTGRWRRYAPVLLTSILLLSGAGCVSSSPSYARWTERVVAETVRAVAATNRLPEELSPDEAVRFALAHNPELAVLRSAVAVARADSRAAGDLAEPELRGGYGVRNEPAGAPDTLSRSIALRVFPPNPWTRAARISAAEALAHVAEANVRAATWRVTIGARRFFEEVMQARQALAILDRSVAIRREQVRMLEARLSGGQAMSLEVMDASRRYLEAVAERELMADRRDLAVRQLARLMGGTWEKLETGNWKLGGTAYTGAPMTLDLKNLQEQSLRQRADLETGYWQWRAAMEALAESRTLDWPWLSFVQGTFAATEEGSPAATKDEWRIDVGISIPLFAVWNGAKAAREEKVRQCEMQLGAVEGRILAEVRDAVDAVRQAADRVRENEATTTATVARMKQLLADMSARQDVSAVAVADLKEAITRSEYTLLAPQFEYRKALLSLEEALGSCPRDDSGAR